MLVLLHKDEWEFLVNLARRHGLTTDKIIFLLALRELENGVKGNEFNVRAAQGAGLEEQALWAIGSIKRNERRWQKFVVSKDYMTFTKFFGCLGGPYGTGWRECISPESTFWEDTMEYLMEEIQDEFERGFGVDCLSGRTEI